MFVYLTSDNVSDHRESLASTLRTLTWSVLAYSSKFILGFCHSRYLFPIPVTLCGKYRGIDNNCLAITHLCQSARSVLVIAAVTG